MANKIAVIGICSVFMVALVVAVVVGVTNKNKDDKSGEASESEKIASSKKAIESMCQPVAYRETCEKSLQSSNSTDPKELIRVGFNAAVEEIKKVISKSDTIKELNKDENTKAALRVCKEVLDYAIDDLKRSFDELGEYDMSKVNDIIMNLKVWLSGTITSQQTCIDSFEEANNESAEKMMSVLQKTQELTSNALIMIDQIASIVKELNIPGLENIDLAAAPTRKLLSEKSGEFPEWMSLSDRKLLQAKSTQIQPNLVIAKDGSGKFDSINAALEGIPQNSKERFVVHIKAGTYNEQITMSKNYRNIVFIGDGPTKTIISSDYSVVGSKPMKTFDTATLGISGFYFMAKDIGFENTAGPEGHQAVAVRVTSDLAAFSNCNFNGYQDTLYAHSHRQFYTNCEISGTVDFIFGDSKTVFQNCKMIVRKPMANQNNMVTAQGKKLLQEDTGFVLQNCTITGTPDYQEVKGKIKTYLGRPWREYSTTIVMQSQIDDIIAQEGWTPMNGTVGLDTCYYAEFSNRGSGADTTKRVTWKGYRKITEVEAKTFTAATFLKAEDWLPAYQITYEPNMITGL